MSRNEFGRAPVPQCVFVSPGEDMPSAAPVAPRVFEDNAANLTALSAIGHEGRAVLALGMTVKDAAPHTIGGARKLFESMLPPGATIGTKGTTIHMLEGELVRAGLVRVGRVEGKPTVYAATPRALGVLPLIAFSLGWGEENNRSMGTVTGKPSNREGMANPIVGRVGALRYVYEHLSSGEEMAAGELNHRLHEKGFRGDVARGVLKWLAGQNLFTLDRWTISEEVTYGVGERIGAEIGGNSGSLQRAVLKLFGTPDAKYTLAELAEVLQKQGVYTPESSDDKTRFRKGLLEMEYRGQLTRLAGRLNDGEIVIHCTDKQQAALGALLIGLDKFARGDRSFIRENGQRAVDLAHGSDPESLGRAVGRASGKMVSSEGELTKAAILAVLGDMGKDTGVTELTGAIAKQGGRHVGGLAVRRALATLSGEGVVVITQTPGGKLYRLAPGDD